MPFCRKCGRRLPEYSESCPECKTSTTGPLIKIKKAPAAYPIRAVIPETEDKATIHSKPTVISIKTFAPNKSMKTIGPAETIVHEKSAIPAKPAGSAKVYPEHEIIKSNISLKEDIIKNPKDYESQTFSFDLKCSHDHFWPAGEALPISNGKAICLKCGEPLRKTKQGMRSRYPRF